MKRITEIIVSVLTVIALVFLVNLDIKSHLILSRTIKEMSNLLEVYQSQNSLQYHSLSKIVKSILKKDFKQDKKIDKLEKLIEESLHLKSLNVERITRANVRVVNLSYGYSGSGTHIKINDKSYILTCGHLFKSKSDLVSVATNEDTTKNDFTTKGEATVVLLDKERDLALIKINRKWNHPYLKLASSEPKTGDPVWVVGNPYVLNDVISFGRVIRYMKKYNLLCITAKTYFGNSGGAVLNRKGEIVGVMSAIWINFSSYVPFKGYGVQSFSACVRLNVIKDFLKEVK